MKLPAIKGDELFVDQAVARLDVIINVEREQLADFVVVVEAQTIAICRQHQEEIQQIFLWRESREKTVEQQSSIHPSEGWRQDAFTFRQDETF